MDVLKFIGQFTAWLMRKVCDFSWTKKGLQPINHRHKDEREKFGEDLIFPLMSDEKQTMV